MIKINAIEDIKAPTSYSYPFIGLDESGKKWFVKPYLNESGHGSRSLFNELVAFKLAEKIDLPWPKGHVARLSENVKNDLNISISYVIAYEYIPDIEELPNNYKFREDQMDALYGKSIFDNWLYIQDTTYDTCKLLNGKLLFMDAGFAFGGDSEDTWREDDLTWTTTRLATDSSRYLRGNLSSSEGFKSWMDRISGIPVDYYQSIVDSIPQDWNVPESYKSKFVEVFSSSCEVFIPVMTECIEWENDIKTLSGTSACRA